MKRSIVNTHFIEGGHVNNVLDAKALSERAKQLAEERRARHKNHKRKCAMCGVEESDKTPFVAHPDGIGPSCRDSVSCQNNRSGVGSSLY